MLAYKLVTAPTVEPLTLNDVKEHLRLDSGTFGENIATVQSIVPGSHVVAANYSLVGTGVDVLGYRAVVNLNAGTCGAGGSVAAKIQESDDNITYADWTGGGFTTVTEANDNAIQEKEYTGAKQYVRVVATVAVATCQFGADVIKGQPYSAEDNLLSALIIVARDYCEGFHRRSYITQTWELWLDGWPEKDWITLDFPPLQKVNHVKYYETDNSENTFTPADYFVDTKSEPGRVALGYSKIWPSEVLRPTNGVVVNYDAGYGGAAASVPEKVKQAMKLLVGHYFKHREATDTALSKEVEFAVHALLWQDRVLGF